jgi:hypothetical protein
VTDLARLKALKQVADLIQDRDLGLLAAAGRAKAHTEAKLMALDNLPVATGLHLAAMAQVEAQYGLWAAQRRAMLNQQLSRETAHWLNARDAARKAFGRAQVFAKLTERP